MDWLLKQINCKVEDKNHGGKASEDKITDQQFYDEIAKTNLLANISKVTYHKRLLKVTNDMFDKPVSIWWVIHHPEEFKKACIKWCTDKKVSLSTGSQYVIPFTNILLNHREIQEANPQLKSKWRSVQDDIKSPDEDNMVDNQPSEKQTKANIPFTEICQVRDNLPEGCFPRLLLCLYTMIEPVRSDFDLVKLYLEKPEKSETPNFLVIGKTSGNLYLNEYKTSNHYDHDPIELPKELLEEIKVSLKKFPREYLFVDKQGLPYTKPATFNRWANRVVKTVLKNESITLTSFRHIYLSRPDLKLEEKTIGERKKIAKNMGHSLSTQKTYVWKGEGGGEAPLKTRGGEAPP
jgi:hypothetical protein